MDVFDVYLFLVFSSSFSLGFSLNHIMIRKITKDMDAKAKLGIGLESRLVMLEMAKESKNTTAKVIMPIPRNVIIFLRLRFIHIH